MKDSFQREINYLRVSVTDNCNYHCFHCRPEAKVNNIFPQLETAEIINIIEVASKLGIRKVRYTGGEPLLRPDLLKLIEQTAAIAGIEKISLTTNGKLLIEIATDLRKAGVTGLNLSVNSLNPDKYRQITGQGEIADLFQGIEAAFKAGYPEIKINVVYLKGFNQEEITDFIQLTRDPRIIVRFIELMPKGQARIIWKAYFSPIKDLRKDLFHQGLLIGEDNNNNREKALGPSKYYQTPWGGKVGLIGLISDHYCHQCNRLRLTTDGQLFPCLMSPISVDLKPLLKISQQAIAEAFEKIVSQKPLQGNDEDENLMHQIGG